jgi:hypothetical protein
MMAATQQEEARKRNGNFYKNLLTRDGMWQARPNG